MPNDVQMYAELAERQAQNITGSRENWTSFLSTTGRLYKYPFEEQLMIHAQRPDAQACAPFELWTKNMNRYIKYGSKGIALLDMRNRTDRQIRNDANELSETEQTDIIHDIDFDLTLYNDHDIIGYNKDGVEYVLGRSGSLTYVTSTGMLDNRGIV